MKLLLNAISEAIDTLDSIGCIAHCAPNDDEQRADEEFKRIVAKAYARRDALRGALDNARTHPLADATDWLAERARCPDVDPAERETLRRLSINLHKTALRHPQG